MTTSIAVAGKGGTGKSTIAALLVTRLLATGRTPVLAVDADPDCNLGTLLGEEPEETIGDLREDLLKTIKDFPAGMTKANYIISKDIPGPGIHSAEAIAEGAHVPVVFSPLLGKGTPYQNGQGDRWSEKAGSYVPLDSDAEISRYVFDALHRNRFAAKR